MKEKPKTKVVVLGVILALALIGLFITDDGDIAAMGTCAVSGEFVSLPSTPKDFTADYFGHEWSGNTANLVDASIYLSGAWERPVLYAIRDALQNSSEEKKGYFLDIGANVGTHSFFAAPYSKTVYAVEPWPTVLTRMEAFIKKEKIMNVEIHAVGYANEPGEMPFIVPPDSNLGIGTFSTSRFKAEKGVIQLPLVVADDDLEKRGVKRIDVVKIDIEGYEKPALKGLKKTMERDRPVVILELNTSNKEGFHSMKELSETFPKDYKFYEIHEQADFLIEFPGGTRRGCVQKSGDYDYQIFKESFQGEPRVVAAIPNEKAEKLVAVSLAN